MTTIAAAGTSGIESAAVRAASARWLETVGTGDVARVVSVYTEDGAFLAPNAPRARGREAIEGIWSQLLAAPHR